MTSTAFDDQFAVCTPEEEEAFKAIEARQAEVSAQRKAGWYWVKVTARWEPAYFDGLEFTLDHGPIAKLGPRIPTPDEPWQCVPKEPTQEMQNHGSVARYHERLDCKGLYKAMLSAAPKPEDV